jgi:uncharacterized membrane protein
MAKKKTGSDMKEVLKAEDKIEHLEEEQLAEEKKLEGLERDQVEELKKLEDLEKSIKKDVAPHPLTKITYRDLTKGTIGAFIGIVSHFAFLEGLHVSEKLSMLRATLLLIVSFLIGVAFIYFSGFRRVKQVRALSIIPIRVLVIYGVSLAVVIVVLALFGQITAQTSFQELYKNVAAISILAILGASAADLIGRD